MVEVAEELVEPVGRRQHLVAVAEVVLAELAGHVALRLEQVGDGRVFLLHAFGRARQADLGEAGADGRLPGDERRAAGGAALLAIPVGEQRAFLGDAVDVRRLVAHHAHVVGADVELADVIAPDDEDVGLLVCRKCRSSDESKTDDDYGKQVHNSCFHVILHVKMLVSTKSMDFPPVIYAVGLLPSCDVSFLTFPRRSRVVWQQGCQHRSQSCESNRRNGILSEGLLGISHRPLT